MKETTHNIERLFAVIDKSLFMTTGTLDYDRITDALIVLANTVHDYDGDIESIWYIGETTSNCTLADMIVGAYWHYIEWHGGQYPPGYTALCALGQVFSPGMSGLEPENEVYQALDSMADMKFNVETN